MVFAFFQQHGAERRREREGDEGGNQDGDRNGQSKLLVENPHDAGEEGDGDENGCQDGRDADDRALDLFHGNDGRFARRFVVVAHFVLDGFNDDDGVIDDEPNRQDHGEEGQRIDGEAEQHEGGEGPEQGNGDRDHRNERGAPILQEEIHDDTDQNQRFEEGVKHFFDGGHDEFGIVDDDVELHVSREGFRVFLKFRFDGAQRLYRICIRRE